MSQSFSSLPLIQQFCVVLSDHVAANASLEVGDDLREALVSHLLQLTEDPGLEEDLRVTDTVVLAQIQSREYLLGREFTVDEAWRDGIRCKDGVS